MGEPAHPGRYLLLPALIVQVSCVPVRRREPGRNGSLGCTGYAGVLAACGQGRERFRRRRGLTSGANKPFHLAVILRHAVLVTNLVERLVPDGLWELFQRVVPPAPVRPQGGGRRRHGDREVLAAIVFVAMSGCTWQQLPPGFGPSGVTAYRRFAEWSEARVWAKLNRLVLDELGARGDLDWSRCAIDSVSIRALKGGG